MIRLFFTLSLLGISGVAMAAVTATVRPNPVLPGEFFELTITQSPAGTGEPELLPLPEGVRELQRQTSQSTQIFNGSRSTSRSWLITLVAAKPGDYPLRVAPLDGETIAPVTITVQKPDPSAAAAAEVFAHFTADTKTPWVGAEVILQLRVYIAGELDSGSLPDPVVPGLVIEKLAERNDGEELISNQRYRVLERDYVAFPERPGPITIPGPVFSGQLVDRSRRSRFPAFSVPTRRVSTVAEDITLDVRPAQDKPDAVWIPAQQVRITDSLDIPNGQAEQGQALTRTVRLEIDGQLHTQVPDLNWPLPPRDMAQSFAEEPQRTTQTQGGGVKAVVIQKFVHIPQTDLLQLPAVHLPWFNTRIGQWEQAELPARSIRVKSITAASRAEPTPLTTPNPSDAARPAAIDAPQPATESHALRWWRALALGSSVGWLLTLVGWGWLARRPAAETTDSSAFDPMADASLRQQSKDVLHHAKQGDAQATAKAVRRWAHHAGLMAGATSSQDLIGLAQVARGQALEQQLQNLSAALYGRGQWSGAEFANAFRAFVAPRAQPEKQNRSLPPLYPDD